MELFEGNKAEVKTLLACIESWKAAFKIGQVCFVADRAMMSHENLSELERLNYTYVIAAKLRSMSDEMQERILCGDNYKLQSFGDHPDG